MDGHGHPLVMVMNTADELRQMGLDVSQREHGHSQKYDQKSGQCQGSFGGRTVRNPLARDKQEVGSMFNKELLAW